jgi:hypothetical protein
VTRGRVWPRDRAEPGRDSFGQLRPGGGRVVKRMRHHLAAAGFALVIAGCTAASGPTPVATPGSPGPTSAGPAATPTLPTPVSAAVSPASSSAAGPSVTPAVTPSSTPSGPVPTATPTRTYVGSFVRTGRMTAARDCATATLLDDGRVLLAGGVESMFLSPFGLASAELYDLATGAFTQTSPMTVGRARGTATLLRDGRVLIAGGESSPDATLASGELYDPGTGTFTGTGELAQARSGQTATRLGDGRVLIAGGWDGNGAPLASAELYDPATGRFAQTGSMADPRSLHTATALTDGRVLVTGGITGYGNDQTDLGSAELYDPATGTFVPTGAMSDARAGHTATLLADGTVLVVPGTGRADVYDPATGRFVPTGSLGTGRQYFTATLLADGRVLIAGGQESPAMTEAAPLIATAEVYDPATRRFTDAGELVETRMCHTATLLGDGRVLLAGGGGQTVAELYE